MDVTYKFILDKRRAKQNNKYPLKLRLYENSKYKEKSLGVSILENEWDNASQTVLNRNKQHKLINYKLNSLKNRIDRFILLNAENRININDVLNQLDEKQQCVLTFKQYSNSLIEDLIKSNRIGTALAYKDASNSLISFADNDLKLPEIDYKFIDKYNTYMLSKGIRRNSIAAYLRSIRAILNKAIKEQKLHVEHYPFKSFKIITEKTFNKTLSIKEANYIFNIKLERASKLNWCRNNFILSFALIGINYTDMFLLEKNNIYDNNLKYIRSKTKKLYSIRLHEIVSEILNEQSTNSKFLLHGMLEKKDAFTTKKHLKQLVKTNNHYLKILASKCGINKPVTTYYARYSWANIAKELGYSKDMIAEALGHEYGNQVTGIYLDDYDLEKINSMNEHIINE